MLFVSKVCCFGGCVWTLQCTRFSGSVESFGLFESVGDFVNNWLLMWEMSYRCAGVAVCACSFLGGGGGQGGFSLGVLSLLLGWLCRSNVLIHRSIAVPIVQAFMTVWWLQLFADMHAICWIIRMIKEIVRLMNNSLEILLCILIFWWFI